MLPFNFVRWVKSLWIRPRGRTIQRRPLCRLRLEHLEDRLAPATTFIWDGGAGAVDKRWSTAKNWVGDVHPTGLADNHEDLIFSNNAPSSLRSTLNDIGGTFNSITFGDSDYILNGSQITLGDPSLFGSGFIIANAGVINNNVTFDIQLDGSGQQFFTVQSGGNLTLSGKLLGSSGIGLTKEGTGTLILSNDNSGFAGEIKIDNDAGILQITNAMALGDTTAVTTVGVNSTLQVNSTGLTFDENLILNGSGVSADGGLMNFTGANTWAGNIVMDSNSAIGAAPTTSLDITGQVSDLGAGHNLTKVGQGQVFLSSANTYRGQTIVNNGILTIRNPLALGEPLPGGDPPSLANGTIVNSNVNTGSGTLQIEDSAGSGFVVQDELLTLNGPGFTPAGATSSLGALHNLQGNNSWEANVILGSSDPDGVDVRIGVAPVDATHPQTDLALDGVIDDPNRVTSLTKILDGKLILTNKNTYLGGTIVLGGILNIRDSHALGNNSSDSQPGAGTSVRNNATLELEVDDKIDSETGESNTLLVKEGLTMTGRGINLIGALHNLSGINIYAAGISMIQSAGSIGVEPDPSPNNNDTYFTDDYSLTVTGVISGGGNTPFFKFGDGQLILPVANNYTGKTTIDSGWVTIQNNLALGQRITGLGDTVQPGTKVLDGAALHLKPLTANSPPLNVPENLTLTGLGIDHAFALINNKGALMNLGGDNIVSGDIQLIGTVGIGSELLQSNHQTPPVGELTLTGSIYEFTANSFETTINPTGGSVEDRQLIDTGATSGSITVSYDMFTIPDRLRVYYPPEFQGGAIIKDTGLVSNTGTFTVPYGPGPSTLVEFVMNEGGGLGGTAWTYTATITPNSPPVVGGITKFGSKRLNIQGDGTYTGPVDVAEGVLRAQNDTALGIGGAGTTVESGAALEIKGGVAKNNGGIAAGIQAWNEHLTIQGPGNTTTSGSLIHPLTVLSEDNMWRGPVTLSSDTTIDVQAGARVTLFGPIDDASNPDPAGSAIVKEGEGKLVLAGTNSYRGVTYVNQGIVNLQNGQALGATGPTHGTIVADGASLELQGDITVAGEYLTVQGTGAVPVDPAVNWFQQGPAPIPNGQTLGNQPVSGRITGVASDPTDSNTIYISTAGGGAWKTKNGGKTWLPLIDNIIDVNGNSIPIDSQTMFTGAIAVAPTDPRFIYVGTGETNDRGISFYGRGVLRSMDSGKTWTLLGPPAGEFERKTISKIVVDPLNENVFYVALSNNGSFGLGGDTGIWRYNGAWTNLTALAGGPTDTPKTTFFTDADYSDLVVVPDPSDFTQTNRIIAFAQGTAWGGPINGNLVYSNAVYVSLNSGATWTRNSFATTEQQNDFFGFPELYPVNGVIKIGISRFPGFNPFSPGPFTVYAAVTYPTLGWNTTANPPPFGQTNQHLEHTLRNVWKTAITWNAAQGQYQIANWATTTRPPQYMGAAPNGQGDFDTTLIVDPYDPTGNTVYVAGVGQPFTPGPFKTTTGGTAWVDIGVGSNGNAPHVDYHAMAFDKTGANKGRLLVGNDGGIWRLDNPNPGSILWTDLNGNLAITQFNAIASHPTDASILFGGSQDNGTETFTGDQAWTLVEAGDGGVVRIDQKNPSIVYHVLNDKLRRSVNGGTTWIDILNQDNLPSGTFTSGLYFPFLIDPINSSRVLVGGDLGVEELNFDFFPSQGYTQKLLQSISGLTPFGVSALAAANYQGTFKLDPNFPLVTDKGANTYDPDTIYATDGVTIYLTKNHGIQWQDRTGAIAAALATGNTIVDLAVDPTNRDIAYAVVSGFSDGAAGKVFRTPNAGLDWIDITGNLPDVPSYKIVIDPRLNADDQETIYLGNDQGVFRSTDTTALNPVWERFGRGLPNVQARDLTLNQALNTLTVGTYGRSAYQLWLDDSAADAGALRSLSGSAVWTGPVFLAGDTTISANGNQNIQNGVSNAQLTILGVISDDPSLPPDTHPVLTKIGQGNVVLGGTNTYTGETHVDKGVLVVQNPAALGKNASNGGAGTTVNDGAALDLQSSLTGESLDLYGNGVQYNDHNAGALRNLSNNNTYTGTITLQTDSTIGVDTGTTLTINNTGTGLIDDGQQSFNLTKEGTGTLVLGGANTYDGTTRVQQGALRVISGKALGSTDAGTIVVDGAQLQLLGGITVNGESLTLSGAGIFGAGALYNAGGNNTWQGPVSFASIPGFSPDTVPPANVAINVPSVADHLTLDGLIEESVGSFGLTKIGAGMLILTHTNPATGPNTYSGVTTVANGMLRIKDGGTLGTAENGTVVNSGAALELEGDFTVTDEAVTLNGNGVGGAGAMRGISGNNTWAGNVLLKTNSSIGVVSGLLDISGIISDNGTPTSTLQKVGPGRLELDGINTYGGLTTITAGELQVGGTSVPTAVIGNVSLNGGALGGTGTVGTVTMASTGTVNPGDNALGNPGTLHTGPETWNAGTTFFVNLVDAVTYDALAVTGNINITGATLAGLVGIDVSQGDTFTILTTSGGVITGAFANAATQAFLNGVKFDIIYNSTSIVLTRNGVTDVSLIGNAIPNPSQYGEDVQLVATLIPEAGSGAINGGIATFILDGDSANAQTATIINSAATLNASAFGAAFPLSLGNHQVSLSFSEPNFTPASGTINFQVNQANTTTTVTGSSPSSVFGALVTFTATVTGPGAGQPTGTVTFTDTFNSITTTLGAGTFDPASGAWKLSTAVLEVGGHTIKAFYSGDTNFIGSVGVLAPYNISKADTSTTISAAPASSTYGETVTFTAVVGVVPPGSGTLIGQIVTFKDNGNLLGTGTLTDVGGFATAIYTTTATQLGAGTHVISAEYAGTADLGASFNVINDYAVAKAGTSTNLSASPSTSGVGDPVTFTATVTGSGPGAPGTPTGMVTFVIDNSALTTYSANLDTNGMAAITRSDLLEGSHSVVAFYNGDDNFDISTSNTITQIVLKTTTTVLTANPPSPSGYGQPVTFTGNVTAASGTPTGTLTLQVDSNPTVVLAFSGSPVDFPAVDLAIGSHTVTLGYSGDADFAPSSTTITQVVGKGTATTTVTQANPTSPSTFGDAVTFTATVIPIGNGVLPTGTVTFKDGSTVLGTGDLLLVLGVPTATYTTTIVQLTGGTHIITAVYGSDDNYNTSTSPAFTYKVNPHATVATITQATPSPSAFGQPVKFTVTITPTIGGVVPGGTVTFKDGGATMTTVPVTNVGGVATATFTTGANQLTEGSHTITADYNGNVNYAPSTSAGFTQEVLKLSTTTLTSSLNPAPYGTTVTFTANVTGSGTPTGTLTFNVDAQTPVVLAFSGSPVVFTPPALLSAGSHTITVDYSGDATFVPSAKTVTEVINKANTTTTVTQANPSSPSIFGDAVIFTATVTAGGSGDLPTGTVTFKDGATVLGTGDLSAVGGIATATYTTTVAQLTGGPHIITAVYGNNVNYNGGTSANFSYTVNPHASVSTITQSSANPSAVGQPVTFTVTVTPGIGGVLPTGTLTFKDGVSTLGTSTALANVGGVATATFTTTANQLAEGSHTITAAYIGTANFATSTSADFTQVVRKLSTATLISSLNPSPYGTTVSFTANVTGSVVTPTGTVTFKVDAQAPVTMTFSGSPVVFTPAALLDVGSHTITVDYSGDATYVPSTKSLTQVVNKANTTTTVTGASPTTPSTFGDPVTFTATVTRTGAGVLPTGTVTFKDGANTLGTGDLTVVGGVATATFTTGATQLAAGPHIITAVYGSDANYNGGTSANFNYSVKKAATTQTIISSSPSPSTIGQPVTFTVTVTPAVAGVLPTGKLTFKEGVTTLGFSTTLADVGGVATATFTINTLTGGLHNITATYIGDLNYAGGTSAAFVHKVLKATTTTLSASANPATINTLVTFTATVTGAGVAPTGTVTFFDGAVNIGSGTIGAGGKVSITTSFAAESSHAITAVYSGDSDFSGGTSAVLTQRILLPATALTAKVSSSHLRTFTAFAMSAYAIDVKGQLITNYTGTATFKVIKRPSHAHVFGKKTATFVKGVAKFRNLSVDKRGTYIVRITSSTGLTLTFKFRVTGIGRR